LWKEDRKVIQVFGPLTPSHKEKLEMVELLEDLGKKRSDGFFQPIVYPGDGRRCWALFADG
jgi:hypothetical protein